MIEALIFDLDDTLLDNTTVFERAFKEVYKKYNSIVDFPPDFKKGFYGKKGMEIAIAILEKYPLPITPEQLLEEQQEIFRKYLSELKPMPGFEELIPFLRECSYMLALATSGKKRNVEQKLSMFNLQDLFKIVITGDEIKNGKPDPEIFLKAAECLNVSPENCVVIEDADNGIQAAKKAGMKGIGLRNTLRESYQSLNEADVIIKSLSEIPEVLKRM